MPKPGTDLSGEVAERYGLVRGLRRLRETARRGVRAPRTGTTTVKRVFGGGLTGHGSAAHSGKIGENNMAVVIAVKKPLPGIANDAAENPLPAPFAFTGKKLKARARSNLGTTATFRVTIAGTDRGSVTINSGASSGTADVTDFSVAEDDEIDVDETAGGTDDVAVSVIIMGEADVSAAIA